MKDPAVFDATSIKHAVTWIIVRKRQSLLTKYFGYIERLSGLKYPAKEQMKAFDMRLISNGSA